MCCVCRGGNCGHSGPCQYCAYHGGGLNPHRLDPQPFNRISGELMVMNQILEELRQIRQLLQKDFTNFKEEG